MSDAAVPTEQFKLLPHQQSFVDEVLSSRSRSTLLKAPVGLGKGFALVALASRLLREEPRARILFITASSLREQFSHLLHQFGVQARVVGRHLFREWLDQSTDGVSWAQGQVAVISWQFALQDDVLSSLRQHWSLVVFDDVNIPMSARRAAAVETLMAVAERLVLSTTSQDVDVVKVVPSVEKVIEWRFDAAVDWDGRPLRPPKPLLKRVSFELTPNEEAYYSAVCDLIEALKARPESKHVAEILLRALQSSPAAVEGIIVRILSTPAVIVHGEFGSDEQETRLLDEWPATNEIFHKGVASFAIAALAAIENAKVDSKLVAFGALLKNLLDTSPPNRLCVITKYVSTLHYLSGEFDPFGDLFEKLHGGQSLEERAAVISNNSRRVLLATSVVIPDLPNSKVPFDFVLYDIPRVVEQQAMLAIGGGRLGNRARHSIYALTLKSARFGEQNEQVSALESILNAST